MIDEEHEVGKSYGLKLVMENGTIVRTLVVVTWTRYVEKQQGYATGLRFVDLSDDERERRVPSLALIEESTPLE